MIHDFQNQSVSSLGSQSAMDIEQAFELPKVSIKRVRGVWDMQIRMTLVGEQMGQICAEAPEGRAQAAVRVGPVLAIRSVRSFLQKVLPTLVPQIEHAHKCCLGRYGQSQNNRPQLLPGNQVGVSGQVPTHNGHLVELTKLHREIVKYPQNTAFSVNDRCFNRVPTGFQVLPRADVLEGRLRADLVDMNVPLEARTAHHQHAIAPSEEGRVRDRNDGLGRSMTWRDWRLVELTLDPTSAPLVVFRQLADGLTVPDVLPPERAMESGMVGSYDELFSARSTSPSLLSIKETVLPNSCRVAPGTLFLRFIGKKIRKVPLVLHKINVSSLLFVY